MRQLRWDGKLKQWSWRRDQKRFQNFRKHGGEQCEMGRKVLRLKPGQSLLVLYFAAMQVVGLGDIAVRVLRERTNVKIDRAVKQKDG
jgi:hypothetical protein